MRMLLLFPMELYVISRFADACRRHGGELLVLMSPTPPLKSYLMLFKNEAFQNIIELPPATDGPDALLPYLEGVEAVIPAGEFSVTLADELAERLGLFHNPPENAPYFRNKFLMREKFAEFDIQQPGVIAKFEDMEGVEAFDWESVRFPVVVKPVDLSASLYVRVCDDALEAKKILRRIFMHRRSFSGISFAAHGMLEEVVFGSEYSVECIVYRGEVLRTFLTTKFLSPDSDCNEIGHLSGEAFDDGTASRLNEMAQQVANAWQLDSGVVHIEFKLHDGRMNIIEAACRIAGDMISELTELEYGISLEECFVLLRSGEGIDSISPRKNLGVDEKYYYGLKFVFPPDADLKIHPEIEVLRKSFDKFPENRTGTDFSVANRVGHLLVRSRSIDVLRKFLEGKPG